ncbi:MAG: AraC family transcriptional regulator [FCB group bacterium]|nr:AraC family transcriptional regulator [FCB group bacterium]
MDNRILHIRNMVCPRCIMAVEQLLDTLEISYSIVKLGEVILKHPLSSEKSRTLAKGLKGLGFELLDSGMPVLISKIKTLIIEQVHYADDPLIERFSSYLARELHYDYGYLSHLFSSVENMTIEKFIVRQKIEKVKELLFYNELTLSEIAYRLGYSSVSHLSAQFKKETGLTPTAFKKQNKPAHCVLDM